MSWLISGVGAATSVGRNVDELFTSLCAGRDGLAELRGFERDRFRVRHAYEIDNRPEVGRDVPGRATDLLLEVIGQAVGNAGLGGDLRDVPILVGTGLRELRSAELWWSEEAPFTDQRLDFGLALRERFGAVSSHTFANACAASLCTLALATDLLATDRADCVVVAGVDVLTESMHGLLDRVHPVPPGRVRPFDRDREGVLMGDGAGAVVLRRESGTPAPGNGRLRAVGMNCDAYHVTAPDPAGIASAMRQAHQRAGTKVEAVDLVMLHGTGTLLNDEAEATALGEVFGEHLERPAMTAIKSMTGHTSGASGVIGLVVALRCMTEGTVPPTVALANPVDEAARLRIVRDQPLRQPMSLAQVNAFGFGGINAVALVEVAR